MMYHNFVIYNTTKNSGRSQLRSAVMSTRRPLYVENMVALKSREA